MNNKTPIWGTEGYVNGNGEICHKTVCVGYKEGSIREKQTNMKTVYGCDKCKLTFPQYPELRHCPQCGMPLIPLKMKKPLLEEQLNQL